MSLRPRMNTDEIHAAAQEARQRMRAGTQAANRPVVKAVAQRTPRRQPQAPEAKLQALAEAFKGGPDA